MTWAKTKSALAVIVVSCLIWVYAERRVTRPAEFPVTISLDNPSPDLLLQLLDETGKPAATRQVRVDLTVRGSNGLIQAVNDQRLIPEAPRLTLRILGYQDSDEPGSEDLSALVVKDVMGERLGFEKARPFLQVIKAQPERIRVRVTRLVEKTLDVRVFDSLGLPLKSARVEPAQVKTFVISGQPADARVVLGTEDLLPGREVVQAQCRISIADNVPPQNVPVEVHLPAGPASPQTTHTITSPRIGYVMPEWMQGKYTVVIENPEDMAQLREPISCLGSEAAFLDFKDRPSHILIEIVEPEDKALIGEPVHCKPRYNLPPGGDLLQVERQVPLGLVLLHLEPLTGTSD